MKKIISTILALAMIITMVNIPMVIKAEENAVLYSFEEDYKTYANDSQLENWFTVIPSGKDADGNTIADLGVVNGEGYKITQVNPKLLKNATTQNRVFSPEIHKNLGSVVEDKENRTVLKHTKLQGKYEIELDYSANLIDPTIEDAQALGFTGSSWYTAYHYMTLAALDDISSSETEITKNGIMDLRMTSSFLRCTYASKKVSGYQKDQNLDFDSNIKNHSLKFTVDTVAKTSVAMLDDNEKIIVPFVSDVNYFNTLSIKCMERVMVGSYITVERLKVSQIETEEANATLAVVNALPVKLVDNPESVTENITMPDATEGVVWKSSDTDVITDEGVVVRASEDKEVVITATVDLNNNGGVYVKEYMLTVPKTEEIGGEEPVDPPQPPVEDDGLIRIYEDFTQYSHISQVPNFVFGNDTHASVTAEKGRGIVISQHTSTPLAGNAANGAAAPNVAHAVSGTFNVDEANRTNYRIDRFSGKYKIIMDFRVKSDAYPDNKYDGVDVSQPYYNFAFGSVPDVNNFTTTITANGFFFRMNSKRSSVLNSNSASANTVSPNAVYYSADKDHQLVMTVDTNTQAGEVDIDATGKPAKGNITKKGYINAFSVAGFQRMLVGSEFVIKSLKFEQLEKDAETDAAMAALDALPDSLATDPYGVTENIILPQAEYITWSTTDSSIIDENGVITRWYDDREVTVTATYANNSAVLYKDYKLTVKAVDSYYSKGIMNNSGNEFSDVITSGDISVANATVSDKGITVEKTIGGEDVEGENVAFSTYYRMFGEEIAYNELTKSSIFTSGYMGTYDVDFELTPEITGNKPLYVALGEDGKEFVNAVALRFAGDNISVSHDNGLYDAISEETYGKVYKVRFRVDTDSKKAWIFINGKMIGTFFNVDNAKLFGSLCITVDKNSAKGDKVTINNLSVTELVKNDVEERNLMISALESIEVNDITSTPDAVESINKLPEKAGDYNIVWSSNSNLIDIENGKVNHGENDETVIVSAAVNKSGIYVRKDFVLTVCKAANSDELLDGYIIDLAKTITNQNPDDLRYDINLPNEHNGLSIQWDSSKPQLIDINGKINTNTAILTATPVTLTAKITMNGTEYYRTFNYTVSPRAYTYDVLTLDSDFESITVNGTENVAITRDTFTNIQFKQTGDGTITLADKSGKKIAVVNVNDGVYNVIYRGGITPSYNVADGETVNITVFTMPDIDKLAVWINGERIADYVDTIDAVTDLSSVAADGNVEVTSAKITTDEYGVLDINLTNIDYFAPFAKNVVKEDVSIVNNTVIDTDVEWKSSNTSLIADNGKVTNPDVYGFATITLTLSSKRDADVKRVVSKKIAVACPADKNIAKGAKVSTSVTEKPGFVKNYLTDGDLNTSYATSYTNKKPELTIDFGKEEYFNSVYVNESFENYEKSLKSYSIAYSNDGENWTEVKNGTISGIESTLIGFDTVYARYLKFTATECDLKDLYINELEVYLFATSFDLVKLDVDRIDLGIGSTVKEDIELPQKGYFGTNLVWTSSNPEVISNNGKVTRGDENVTVILTVTAEFEDKKYSREFSAYVPAKTAQGAKPIGGSGGGGGSTGGMGTGTSTVPGLVETDIKEEITEEPETTVENFTDLPNNHWAYKNVMNLKELGVIDGIGDNKFNPSGIVTREQFLKMLVEATGIETKLEKTAFADIDADAWYAPYVSAGVNAGLINGITDDTFGVGSEIKRQDMAVMIARILDAKNIPVTQTSETFEDDAKISDYAKNAVYKVRDAGVINGYADNTFAPSASLTRAEAATVIIKLLDKLQ